MAFPANKNLTQPIRPGSSSLHSEISQHNTWYRNVQRFRGGLVFKAHRLLYHSTLGLRVIKKKKTHGQAPQTGPGTPRVRSRAFLSVIGSGLIGWEGYRESRRCSRDTYPESCITKYTSIRRKPRYRLQFHSADTRSKKQTRKELCKKIGHANPAANNPGFKLTSWVSNE